MTTIEEMLRYYGFNDLKEYGKSRGYCTLIDAERALRDSYEEDILWED